MIRYITAIECKNTNLRIHMENYEIHNMRNISKRDDAYEWTETLDGKINKNNTTFFFNLKFVCETGGAQLRTMREIYHFIKAQVNYLKSVENNTIYFVNILDGHMCHQNMHKFKHLVYENLFIGDMVLFSVWWNHDHSFIN